MEKPVATNYTKFLGEVRVRIANIIEEGKLGGPQIRMVRVASALKGQVETLIIIPHANAENLKDMCKEYKVQYRAMKLTRITKEFGPALSYIIFSPWEILRLIFLFRREQIQLVHASGGSWQYKGVIAARLAGIPVVWHLNDTYMPRWLLFLFRLVNPFSTGFIFASQRSKEYYQHFLSKKFQAVVPSTVDLSKFDPSKVYSGDDAVLEGLGSAPTIGTVANINRIKGLDILINAFAKARLIIPDLRLVIVGPVHKNQIKYFKRLSMIADQLGVSEAIDWTGGRTDVRPILARIDVYVCSSNAESSPVSVWEAMAMARPIVSTNVGDVPLHITNGKQGFIVPVGDSDSIAKYVCELIKNPDLRMQMGISAREAAEIFSPNNIAKLTLEIYRNIFNSKK